MEADWELELPGPSIRAADGLALVTGLVGLLAVGQIGIWAYGVQTGGGTSPVEPLLLAPAIMLVLPMAHRRARSLIRRHTRWVAGNVRCRVTGDSLHIIRDWRWLDRSTRIDLAQAARVEVFARDPHAMWLRIADAGGQHALLGVVESRERAEHCAAALVEEANRRGASWSYDTVDAETWRFGHLPDLPHDLRVIEGEHGFRIELPGTPPSEADQEHLARNRQLLGVVWLGLAVALLLVFIALANVGMSWMWFFFLAAVVAAIGPILVAIVLHRGGVQKGAAITIDASPCELFIRGGMATEGEPSLKCRPRWLAAIDESGTTLTIEQHFRNPRHVLNDRTREERAWVAARLRHYYRIPIEP